mgnify:CR=1 FL=1
MPTKIPEAYRLAYNIQHNCRGSYNIYLSCLFKNVYLSLQSFWMHQVVRVHSDQIFTRSELGNLI